MTPWQIAMIAVQAGLVALAADPNISPEVLGYVKIALDAVNAGIVGFQDAQAGVDPSKLTPIDPIV